MTPARAELAGRALALRAEGWTAQRIADELGVSRSYASALYLDPDGSKERARKDSYRKPCPKCGTLMDGSNGRSGAPSLCHLCRIAYQRTEEYARMIQTWPRERVIEAIRWWVEEYGEPPAVVDWNPYQAYVVFGDKERAFRAERLIAEGRVCWPPTVYLRFGSWNAAIKEAGYEPRPAGGVTVNSYRNQQRRYNRCRRGHDFTPENTYIDPSGRRRCRACRAA